MGTVLRLLISTNSIAPISAETTESLQAKHPPVDDDDLSARTFPVGHRIQVVTEQDVKRAILSTTTGSVIGLDGVRPLHLQQIVSNKTTEACQILLSALCCLCNAALATGLPECALNGCYLVTWIVIRKKDGGLRLIGVSSIYRRLIGRLPARKVITATANQLCPTQKSEPSRAMKMQVTLRDDSQYYTGWELSPR